MRFTGLCAKCDKPRENKREIFVDNSESQARAQLESITEMVANLTKGDDAEQCEALETIQQDALSVEVRSGWRLVGSQESPSYDEYKILLCTGGPAVQIIGMLNEFGTPGTAHIEHQDWGTPWTELRLTAKEEKTVLEYASCFYFEEV